MVIQVTNYVFAPGGAGVGTITFTDYVSIALKNVILITNVTDGEIIYNFRIPGNTGTVAGNVLTLMESTAAMSAGDELQIIYNDPTLTANTSNLATQATLASVLTSLQLLDNIVSGNRALVTEDNSAAILAAIAGTLTVTGTVTANAGTNLNTSALALEATLQSVKTAVEIIDNFISGARGLVTEDNSAAIKTALELIDNAISGNEMQVDVITQPALSQNTDSVAIYGSDDGGTTKRIIKTDAAGEIQVDISSSSLALETTLQSVKTAVEIIDNFISGARGLVTEDNSAAILAALGGTLTIAGTVTANAGTNLNTSALALEATLQSVKTAVEILDNAISGSEMQVDIVASLPAGTNNIGDVDVLTIPGIVGTVADDATTPGNPVMIGGTAKETDGTSPGTVSAEDDVARLITDRNRRLLVSKVHPFLWKANEDHTSAQTNNELKAAPGSGLSIYVTDIIVSNGATAGTIKLVEDPAGTPVDLLGRIFMAINGGAVINLETPIRLTADKALGFTSVTVTTHSIFVSGYIAP